jgi:hypothetical protein
MLDGAPPPRHDGASCPGVGRDAVPGAAMTKLHDGRARPRDALRREGPECRAALLDQPKTHQKVAHPMPGILTVVVIVIIVLFVLGYFGRGRFRA